MLKRIPKAGTMLTGFVILMPDNFDPSKNYTGILFAHGIGQRGDGSGTNVEGWMTSKDEAWKLPELIAGSNHILIAPELYFNENWTDKYFDTAYSYLISNYKVGLKVFLEGVSLGGQEIWSWGANHPDLLLGVHATSAVNVMVDFCKIKCPVLAHHSQSDQTVPFAEGNIAVNKILACGGNAKMIPFGNSHSIWKSDQYGQSVYEQPELKAFFGIGSVPPINPPNPTPTTFKADASATITSVTGNTATLDGSKSVGYKITAGGYEDLVWNLISAPEGKDNWNVFPNYNKTGKRIALQNLIPGEYVFQLVAEDGKGNISTDQVKITVSAAPVGKKIIAEVTIAGKTITIFDDNTWAYK